MDGSIIPLNSRKFGKLCSPRKFGYAVARESVWPPASCEAETTKESIKTKTESGKEERKRKRKDREKEKVGRQSEAQREKEVERETKNKGRHFLLEEQHEIL